MRHLISSNPENLRTALVGLRTATVEAEFGDILVEGSVLTLAHHGSRHQNPAPCLYVGPAYPDLDAIGFSHFDLDAFGGDLAIEGKKPVADSFWGLAAYVDVHGPHRLLEFPATDADRAHLQAFWAFSEKNRVFAPRDGLVADISDKVILYADALTRILSDDKDMLAAGEAFRLEGEKLNKSTFLSTLGDVIVRVGPSFCNHLYTTPSGEVMKAVVGFNTVTGGITVSFADPPAPGEGAVKIIQKLWGPTAGGHAGIAGSPRGQRMNHDDLIAAANMASLLTLSV